MKSNLLNFLFNFYIKLLRVRIGNRKKILFYTDSRGYNVVSKFGKNPFSSYMMKFVRQYEVEHYICPEKFTTIVDFLECIKSKNLQNYDYVILHCGVVDFSPRPLSNIEKVKQSKNNRPYFTQVFNKNIDHHNAVLGPKYYNEDLVTLYSTSFLIEEIGAQLKNIKNLIWVDSNHFVKGWEGNFLKGRPDNIDDIVSLYDDLLSEFVAHKITLKDWTEQQIKLYTIDNIHFTEKGFTEIVRLINLKINNL